MRLRCLSASLFVSALIAGSAGDALAHVSAGGPAIAGKNQVLHFHVGHGCAGADSFRIEVHLPEEVLSVRALPSAWGDAEIVLNDQQIPTSVVWEKADVKEADDQYYEFGLRVAVPDAPFTTLYFPTTQSCRDSEGTETTVEWAALPGEEDPDDEPAPSVVIVPERAPGWNKFTVGAKVEDLAAFFGDAQIVWAGDAAFSANPTTMALIAAEDDVTELSVIEAGTEVWVKY